MYKMEDWVVMSIKTKKDLIETIKPYMKDDQEVGRRFYENFKDRLKITETFEELMKIKPKK